MTEITNKTLRNNLVQHANLIQDAGFRATLIESPRGDSYSVNLDGPKYVGTIGYWEANNVFEFQFNCCRSGDVVVLETKKFSSESEFSKFFVELLKQKLAGENFNSNTPKT